MSWQARSHKMSIKPDVEHYDTTLCGCSQAEGINFSVLDKLRIAKSWTS